MGVKQSVKQLEHSKMLMVRLFFHLISNTHKGIHLIKHFLLSNTYRHILYNKFFHSTELHQTSTTTLMNRYPDVFLACQEYFILDRPIKILSYGCSTGEELLTLRKYFPKSEIVGVDINPYCIKESMKKTYAELNTKVMKSSQKNMMKHGPFDLVLCMAVLQRTPEAIADKKINDISSIYSFEKFEAQLKRMDLYVKEKGLLVVHFTPYLFKHTSISKKYKDYGEVTQIGYSTKHFDNKGHIMENEPPQKSIHEKIHQ